MAITFPDHNDPNNSPVEIDGRTYNWNGFAWELECGSGGGGTVDGVRRVYYGVTPPSGPTQDVPTGSLFTQEDTLKVYVLQDDGTWVETTSCSGGSGGSCDFSDKQCEALKKLVSPYVEWTKYYHFIGYEMGVYANQVRVEWNSNVEDIFQDEIVGWEIDLDGDGNWKDIADLTAPETAMSGFMGTTGTKIVFSTPGGGTQYESNTTYPCLQVRLTVRNHDDDGFEAVETTPPMFIFVDGPHTDEPNPAPQPSWCTI